jgi:glycosyltransferase involved in cell wall biosynthesis
MSITQPYFSVIIPNYKTEPFLEQCLQSLLDQEFTDFEVILLNDGSPGVLIPSNSKKANSSADYWLRSDFKNTVLPHKTPLENQCNYIFQEVAGKDKRFVLIEKVNSGQGPTRNMGIKQSKGKRLVLLDCDDFLPGDYLMRAYEATKTQTDSISYGQLQVYDEGKRIEFDKTQKFVPKRNNLTTILLYPTWTINPVNYFWDLDLLKKYNVGFPDPKRHGEDTSFIIDCVLAMYKEYGSKALKTFNKVDIFYQYRSFPYQNYKADNFEIDLFTDTTYYMKKRLKDLRKISFKHEVLGWLFIVRFTCYKLKLQHHGFKRLFYNITAKFFTIIASVLCI